MFLSSIAQYCTLYWPNILLKTIVHCALYYIVSYCKPVLTAASSPATFVETMMIFSLLTLWASCSSVRCDSTCDFALDRRKEFPKIISWNEDKLRPSGSLQHCHWSHYIVMIPPGEQLGRRKFLRPVFESGGSLQQNFHIMMIPPGEQLGRRKFLLCCLRLSARWEIENTPLRTDKQAENLDVDVSRRSSARQSDRRANRHASISIWKLHNNSQR